LSDIEKSVELFKRRNQVTDVRSEASAYLEESRNYTNQLSDLNIQLDIVQSLERYLSQQKDQFELVPSNLRIDDPTLLEFIVKFNDLQLQRERLLRTAEPTNPLILNINAQLTSLRANILENLRTIRRGLLVTRGNLSTKANSFQSRIRQVPNIERELNAINRQEGVKRDLYVYLLQKREESSLSLASAVSNTRIIDPALATKKPVTPKKPVVFGIAFVLGLLLPFGFIFLPSFLSDTIHKKKDVTKASFVPILGEIGHYSKKGYLAISYRKKTPIIEQFRLIRGNLYHATKGKENQVILITSSIENEGRTFFSINLAASLSSAGKKVVLLDFNLRKPGVLSGLNLQEAAGVSDFLDNTSLPVDELIYTTVEAPDLSIIGAGPIPPNPTEFMMNPRVGQLLADLKARFDHIVIDSSPIGQVADTFSLAPYIDLTIFMVRYNYTPKAQVDTINDVFTNDKLKNPFIVLNDARKFNNVVTKKIYGLKS
jgi:capsular exopolysaccharide synthesis family protein